MRKIKGRMTRVQLIRGIEAYLEKGTTDIDSKAAKEIHDMYTELKNESKHGRYGRRYAKKAELVRLELLMKLT